MIKLNNCSVGDKQHITHSLLVVVGKGNKTKIERNNLSYINKMPHMGLKAEK
jgi:hypothetical protein